MPDYPEEQLPKARYQYIDDWKSLSKKTGGATAGGDLGGRYCDPNDTRREVFFKQDADVAKVIGEYVSAYLMDAVAKSDPRHPKNANLIAHVELAVKNASVDPLKDPEGKCVYLASAGFNRFQEVYKDAYGAMALLSKYEPLREDAAYKKLMEQINPQIGEDGLTTITTRTEKPGIFKLDDIITTMIEHGRYTFLAKILVQALWLDDFDIHFGNIGVVPNPDATKSSSEFRIYKERGSNEIKISYNDILVVRIDTGASFSDGAKAVRGYFLQERKFDGELHPDIFLLPSKEGPVNHFKAISKLVYGSVQFYQELMMLNAYPPTELSKNLDHALGKVAEFFTVESLRKYAEMINFPLDASKWTKDELLIGIKSHLLGNLMSRQENAAVLANKLLTLKRDNETGMAEENALVKLLKEHNTTQPRVTKSADALFSGDKRKAPPTPPQTPSPTHSPPHSRKKP